MIKVSIQTLDGREIALIKIEKLTEGDSEFADYSVRFSVARDDGIGLHQRAIRNFPRKKANVLALFRQALATLDERELEIAEAAFSTDLEW